MTRSLADVRRHLDELILQAGRGITPGDVFERSSSRLRRLVPFDAAAWLGTDPGTGLPTSPVRIDGLEGISQSTCSEHWQNELLLDDVNLFRSLGRAEVPAASLRGTVGEPQHSRRYRRFLKPLGLDDELRAVLRVADAPWGTITLWRREGHPPFTRRETAIVADLSAPLGEALRRHAQPAAQPDGHAPSDRPGLLLFDAAGEVVSVNDQARTWLAQLPAEPGRATDISLIARGAGTAQIADELILSRHTIRDHVKAIFAKVGVSSRGELVAKLFADFYEPAHATHITRVPGD